MYCYKIVRELDGKFVSMYIDNELRLEYKLGKETVPKVGGLFAFSKIEFARMIQGRGLVLLAGEGGLYKDQKVFIPMPFITVSKMKKFWIDEWARSGPVGITPMGTILLSSFTPLEVIWKP